MAKAKSCYKSQFIEISKEIERAGFRFGLNNVFSGYLEYHALKIAAENDAKNIRERQNNLSDFIKRTQPELLAKFEQIINLVETTFERLRDEPCDVLGDIYHGLNLNNEWAGQYFTPDNVARMMAAMLFDYEADKISTLGEPTCGSGVMIIAAAWAMKQHGVNPSEKLLVNAQDLDIRCVWMAYIQLSLLGIPAVVNHGDSLRDTVISSWYTKNYWEVKCKLCVSEISS